jgi:hypothetical protein
MGFFANATNFNVVKWALFPRVFLSALGEKYG